MQGRLATDDEIRDLQHVPAHLPQRVWLAATIGMAERFAYYGTQTLFRQYISINPKSPRLDLAVNQAKPQKTIFKTNRPTWYPGQWGWESLRPPP
ncbi:hypothetical protein N7526_000780 [Penicillium atrosanguineum]|nr:hypothetical protein N7526_000780 [Penicillium atrosanguineum]